MFIKSTPVAAEAMFVVSDNGDNLSPKYAPATTAPAVAAKFASNPIATPIKATPTVPANPKMYQYKQIQ